MSGRWVFLVGVAVLAALVHVVTVLAIPGQAPESFWTRLERIGVPIDGFVRLAPEREGEPGVRGLDPATITIACRFDLARGAVRVLGRLDVDYWGLWAHTESGFVHYAINSRSNGERRLELRIMTEDQLAVFRADLPEDAEQELLIASPTEKGFVVLRALVPEASARPLVEQELSAVTCGRG